MLELPFCTTNHSAAAEMVMATGKIASGTPKTISITFGSMVTSVDVEKCYKYGHLVVMDVSVKITATTAKRIDDLFTVPSDCLPSEYVIFTPLDNTNDIAMNGDITPTGGSHIYRNHNTSMSSIRFHAEYIVP